MTVVASRPAIIAETTMIIAETEIADAIMTATMTTLGAGLDRPISGGGPSGTPPPAIEIAVTDFRRRFAMLQLRSFWVCSSEARISATAWSQ